MASSVSASVTAPTTASFATRKTVAGVATALRVSRLLLWIVFSVLIHAVLMWLNVQF